MRKSLLGGLSIHAFLRRYWQKRPCLVRQALPGFTGILSRDELIAAARRDDVQSRLVLRSGRSWKVRHGPFSARELKRLPPRNWTLLVQEVNHFLPAADALMRAFSFVPLARLDDVMVSLAPPGGGVGPHFDSYDVFLLQGPGRRRWRVSVQADLALLEGAPLKILKRFRPDQEWVLEPGDMLYLPPACAHEGVALDECMTYSIGFRAPGAQELAQAFLDHLRDGLNLPGMYRDADLRAPSAPAAIGRDIMQKVSRMLRGIRWNTADVQVFLGRYLTEPKPHVFFDPPRPALSQARFVALAKRRGVRLDLRSRMLFDRRCIYLNGESHPLTGEERSTVRELANHGALAASATLGAGVADLLYDWYRAGFVHPQEETSRRAEGRKR